MVAKLLSSPYSRTKLESYLRVAHLMSAGGETHVSMQVGVEKVRSFETLPIAMFGKQLFRYICNN